MKIREITENKKQFLHLLLLADEQESMIDLYIERGRMFALYDEGLKALCIVTDESNGVCEIKNIATEPDFQGKGYGRTLMDYVCNIFKDSFHTIIVGTGDSELTLPFYKKCGFEEFRRVENFFIIHYDHPIIECGKQLVDKVYLKKQL